MEAAGSSVFSDSSVFGKQWIGLFGQETAAVPQAAASLALFLFLTLVFASTVFTRMPVQRSYELVPFWSWYRVLVAKDQAILQEILLNIVLFV